MSDFTEAQQIMNDAVAELYRFEHDPSTSHDGSPEDIRIIEIADELHELFAEPRYDDAEWCVKVDGLVAESSLLSLESELRDLM